MIFMQFKKISAAFTIGILSLTVLTACGSAGQSDSGKSTDDPGQMETAEVSGSSKQTDTSSQSNDLGESDTSGMDESDLAMLEGTFRPSDLAMPRQEEYSYPFMGLDAVLPESLMERMDRKEVAMLTSEDVTEDLSAVKYAFLSWNIMTEEQKNAEVEKMGNGYYDWADSLERIGTLGVFQSDLEENLDELTGCTRHQEIGQSADGAYRYYLSTNPKADGELTDEVKQIKAAVTAMAPFQQTSAFDQPFEENNVTNVGEFTTQDINGKTCTQEIFQDYDLTMVNVFATWCSPCVNEIPDLEKLHKEMAEKGVNVIGIVMDAADDSGNPDQEAIDKAKILAERTKATYPFLLPDPTRLNGRLNGINAYPETFFVDRDGNIVGETYSGSSSFEDWKETVLYELESLKGADS